MKVRRAGAVLLLATATAAGQGTSQSDVAKALDRAHAGGMLMGIEGIDVDGWTAAYRAGERLATTGNPPKAAVCAACHGAPSSKTGTGPGGVFPALGGLPAYYLLRQLESFADSTRYSAVMTPIAQRLGDTQRRDIAIYYAVQAPPVGQPAGTDAALLAQGEALARTGSAAQGLQACASCHGPGGAAVPPGMPTLAGQSAPYLERQLERWHEDVRRNDVLGVMRDVALRLTPAQRRAVSLYYAAQPREPAPIVE